ncbi:MAG: carbohydrate kinase family protein [Candidatus Pacebacteria bacterium]|nr:carbohydrate kinase family protein [Candidatus Paceibacterota bacterium]
MFDIITIGGATRDITFLTDKGWIINTPENLTEQQLLGFEYGAKIRSEKVRMNFGGGACNSAATFSRMGFSVAACSKIGGDDNGKSILRNLKDKKISTKLMQTDPNQNSGFSFVIVNNRENDGDRVIFTHKGASDDLEIQKNNIRKTKWIYLTALAGKWKDNFTKVREVMEEDGVKLAWNPGAVQIQAGKKGLIGLIKQTDIFIVNKDEAIELVQSDKKNHLDEKEINDARQLIRVLKDWGAAIVVITDGKNGAYIFDGNNLLKAPASAHKRVDTTGAGDSFGSGLVSGYILTGDLEKALKFGVLNSGGVVSQYGAQNGIMTRQEVEKQINKIEVKKI